MTYVSRPVRAVRREPVPGEEMTLVVRTADNVPPERIAVGVREAGGRVVEELEFETLVVVVEQPAVTDICALDGVTAVETEQVLDGTAGDAGEDVQLSDESGQ